MFSGFPFFSVGNKYCDLFTKGNVALGISPEILHDGLQILLICICICSYFNDTGRTSAYISSYELMTVEKEM
jgi:hypothetical protein